MDQDANRREFTRVSTKIEVEVRAGDSPPITGWTQDVSVRGLFFPCDSSLEQGAECQVILRLGESPNQISLEVKAKLVRVTGSGLAIEFIEMGVEAYEHLRKLVLYNAVDSQKAEQELKDHLGIKERI